MNRFFAPVKNISVNKIIIDDYGQVHHIRDVLRLKVNDLVVVFDDSGNEYECVIEKIENQVTVNIKSRRSPLKNGNTVNLTVACALPKKSNMADIVDKLTQLGVSRIIPLKTERVVVKLDKHKETLLHERYKRIAFSACKQSQRNTLVTIDSITQVNKVISDSDEFDLKLIPTLPGKRKSLKEVIGDCKYKNILVLIGPEGDFSEDEIELAKQNGFIPVSLGDLVLRVEVAAVSVASFIKMYCID